ncbi:MAG: polysaccharide biosynthesis C-terminal domain-containing protein, partial [Gemmatimonadaceae bacterium]
RRMFLYLNLALFAGAVMMVLYVKDFLVVLVAPSFLPAYQFIPILIVITIIQQWTGYCNFGLFLKNATHLYGLSALIGVVAALGLNALLIPKYGIWGAAWATLVAYALRFIPVYYFSQRKYFVNYSWSQVGLLWLLFGAVIGVRELADNLRLPGSIAVSTITLAVIGSIVYLKMLGPDERGFVQRLARRPFSVRAALAAQDST